MRGLGVVMVILGYLAYAIVMTITYKTEIKKSCEEEREDRIDKKSKRKIIWATIICGAIMVIGISLYLFG